MIDKVGVGVIAAFSATIMGALIGAGGATQPA